MWISYLINKTFLLGISSFGLINLLICEQCFLFFHEKRVFNVFYSWGQRFLHLWVEPHNERRFPSKNYNRGMNGRGNDRMILLDWMMKDDFSKLKESGEWHRWTYEPA